MIDEAKANNTIEEFINKQGYIFAKENQKIPPEMSGRLQGLLQRQDEITKSFKQEIEKLIAEEKEAVKELDDSLANLPAVEASEAAKMEEELKVSLENLAKEEEQAFSRIRVRRRRIPRYEQSPKKSRPILVCGIPCVRSQTSQVAELFGILDGSSEHDRIVNKYNEEVTKIQRTYRGKRATAEKELEFKKAQLKDRFKKKAVSAKTEISKKKQELASRMFDRRSEVAKV